SGCGEQLQRTFRRLRKIQESDIVKIADLAHLEITPEEVAMFTPQMTEIVTHVEQRNTLDTSKLEPPPGGLTPESKATDSSRADEALPSLGQKLALAEA